MTHGYPFDRKITAAQLRAARALLGISAETLADMAGIGVATVRRSEVGKGEIGASQSRAQALRDALESKGVRFLLLEGRLPGVAAQP